MMMALGDFIFELNTAPFQTQERSSNYRLAENLAVGGNPDYQALGPGEDTQILSGTLYPEITGGAPSLDELRTMMNTGEPHRMIDGNGVVHHYWYIESINEVKECFLDHGEAQKIEFTINVKYSYKTRL